MKLLPALLPFIFAASPLLAIDWPVAVKKYEALALPPVKAAAPLSQLERYARDNNRIDELAARWEARAVGPAEAGYRILEGKLFAYFQRPDEARIQFQKATAAAPADPAAWLALGEFEQAQKTQEARPALEKALALGISDEDPGTAGESLAADHLANGRGTEAWQVLEKGWTEVKAPATRLRLVAKWAETAWAQHGFAEMLGKMEEAWRDGRDHGAELAQAYLSVGDTAQASAVLETSRKAHPEDPSLRAQAIAVARAAGRRSELARLLREGVAAAPTAESWRDLFVALVENGETEPVRELLTNHGDALAANSATWREVIPRLWQLDLIPETVKVLATRADWEANLATAEALITGNHGAEAEALLWTIFDPKWEAEPLSSFAQENARHPSTLFSRSSLPGTGLEERLSRLSYADTGSVFSPDKWYRGNAGAKMESIYEARTLAVFYLAILAANTDQIGSFLAHLQTAIADWPIEERMLAWSVVEHPTGMWREAVIAGALEIPNPNLERFCRSRLQALARLMAIDPAFLARIQKALSMLDRTKPDSEKSPAANGTPQPADTGDPYRAFMQHDFAKAVASFRAALQQPIPAGRSAAARSGFGNFMMQQVLFEIARSSRDFNLTADACSAALQILCLAQAGESPVSGMGSWDLSGNVGMSMPMGGPFVQRLEPKTLAKLVAPSRGLFDLQDLQVLMSIFSRTQEPQVWALLKPRLDTFPADAPVEARRRFRVAAAYLTQWNGDSEGAVKQMRALLEDGEDLEVRLGLASILRKMDRPAEAMKVLEEMPAPYPAFQRKIDDWRLTVAVQAKDVATAKTLAAKLATEPLEMSRLRAQVAPLESIGLTEEAAAFSSRVAADSAMEEDRKQLSMALRDVLKAQDRAATVALAKTVLSPSPLTANRCNSEGFQLRGEALSALDKIGERQAYTATVEAARPAGDGECDDAFRRAEASGRPEEMLATLRLIQEKMSEDREALQIVLDRAPPDYPGRKEAFEALLLLDPEDTLRFVAGIRGVYEKEQQLPRLVDKLEGAPFVKSRGLRDTNSSEWVWMNLADRLGDQRMPELALRVLLRATQVLNAPSPSLRQRTYQELLRLHRKEEAGQELLAALAPDSGTLPLLFCFRAARATTSDIPIDFDRLKMAQELGILDVLQARLERNGGNDSRSQQARMWVRILQHDSTALPEADAYLANAGKYLLNDTQWTKKFVEKISTWPEAGGLTATALAGFDKALERQPEDFRLREMLGMAKILASGGSKDYPEKTVRTVLETIKSRGFGREQPPGALRQAAEIALATGNPQLLGECAQTLAEKLPTDPKIPLNTNDALHILELASGAGRSKESAPLLAALRQRAEKGSSDLAGRLRTFEIEGEWDRGEFHLSQPIVWLDSDHSTATETSLVWDIGAMVRSAEESRQMISPGSPSSPADHHYTLELFAGSSEGSMESLLRQPQAEIHGSWRGSLPSGTEFVRAAFSDGNQLLLGEPMLIGSGPNLLAVENGRTWSVAANLIKTLDGGPVPGGKYLSYRPEPGASNFREVNVEIGRVKIRPGKDYAISGWLRTTSNHDHEVYLTWRYLNGKNTPISSGTLASRNGMGRAWNFYWQRLSSAFNQQAQGARFPEGTTELELSVGAGIGGFDAAGLSLVELPDSKSSP